MSKKINVAKTNAAKLVKAKLFKGDTVLTAKEFTLVAKDVNPNLHTRRRTKADRARADLALVRTQGTINEFLRPKGMVLKSRGYYSEFYVVKNNDAQQEVARYFRTSDNASNNGVSLRSGILKAKRAKK